MSGKGKTKKVKPGYTFIGLNLPNELHDFILEKKTKEFKTKTQVIIDIIAEKYHAEKGGVDVHTDRS